MWKVFSKYHHLPDHFHDLKTTLQAEFNLLKKATSKNIENIQEAVQSQQAYTTVLCGHINLLNTKLVQLERQVQTHCLYPSPVRCGAVELHSHRLYGEKTRSLESRIVQKCKKNQHQRERRSADI